MSVATTATRVGTAFALCGVAVAAYNRLTVRSLADRPAADTADSAAVTVCVPARDEADRLPALIADLRAQRGLDQLTVRILDDASRDDTANLARRAVAGDPRFVVLRGDTEPPAGWTGKAAACARLAHEVTTPVLVFLDADVRLAPEAIAAAVRELRRRRVSLLAPWPCQRSGSLTEALVQPLLCWSWASTVPVTATERTTRASTTVACGQFLVFDTADYRAIGGHAAVADSVTEDLDIARALRRSGRRTAVLAAEQLAHTRMYRDARELDAGYTRWLWSAYGGSVFAGSAVGAVAALAFLVPPIAALCGHGRLRRTGILGYLAATTSRLLARRLETGRRANVADLLASLAHPLGVAAYFRLWVRSCRLRRRDGLRWKGRALAVPGRTPEPAASV
ncbi:glycosyltransferase [Nocardia callitridis]|uniref:Glycosyltransferase n=1 Tax=Nocardia callitridis TaxID=648753 RepID=A0ABP9KHU9_9NOCA